MSKVLNHILIVFHFIAPIWSIAQVIEDFEDGDLSNNPSWAGEVSKFIIDNGSLRLQDTLKSGTAYLSVESQAIENAEWILWLKMDFNPSSNNFAKIYLTASDLDLSSALDGYFIKLGGTSDEISLYRQDSSQVVEIIDGLDDRIDISSVVLTLRVTRDELGNWELFTKLDGEPDYSTEGSVLDDTYLISNNFGISCQFTATRFDKFYFDDIIVSGNPFTDRFAPKVVEVSSKDLNHIDIQFDEAVDPVSSQSVLHYLVSNNTGNPDSAILDPMDQALIHLTFNNALDNGVQHQILISDVEDLSANNLVSATVEFLHFIPFPVGFRDLVINELLADMNPREDLPESEFVEIFNVGDHPVNLDGWLFTDITTTTVLSETIILPDSFLILSPSSFSSQFSIYGPTMGLDTWPSLNNSGDLLKLFDPEGKLIDSVSYTSEWYNDTEKDNGGWSLEQIDPELNCIYSHNWSASLNASGGTPGSQNSIKPEIEDMEPPAIVGIDLIDSLLISIEFDEPVNLSDINSLNFHFNPETGIAQLSASGFSKILQVPLTETIISDQEYELTIDKIADCKGNSGLGTFTFSFDYLPPEIVAIEVLHRNQLDITFSESVNQSTVSLTNFILDQDIGHPVAVSCNSSGTFCSLMFSGNLIDNFNYQLGYYDLTDDQGNTSLENLFHFTYLAPSIPGFNELLVTEILTDYDPAESLPESQFLELYNTAERDISLKDVIIMDGSGNSTSLPVEIIRSGEYIILCPNSKVEQFTQYGITIGLTQWPGFNQSTDVIKLINYNEELIFRLEYYEDWMDDVEKESGGWSLEMVDTDNPCGEDFNWTASEDPLGGTPGKINSVVTDNPDLTNPRLSIVFASDSLNITALLSEKAGMPFSPEITITPDNGIVSYQLEEDLKTVKISIKDKLEYNNIYRLSIKGVEDCSRNLIEEAFSYKDFTLPEPADSADLLINEILFNPRPGGVDFVEVYNQSSKYIDITGWMLGNFENDNIENLVIIPNNYAIIEPNSFVVFTVDPDILIADYPHSIEESIIKVDNLPSLPDDSGSLVMLDPNGKTVDLLYYDMNYHHELLNNDEGVSLERISIVSSTNDPNNWQSASQSDKFATPGYKNSQSLESTVVQGNVWVEPEIFLPTIGSQNNFTTIRYDLGSSGLIANVVIYDLSGRIVKSLSNHQTVSVKGFFTWDGTDDIGLKVRPGYYLIVTNMFSAKGEKFNFKNKVVVASSLD